MSNNTTNQDPKNNEMDLLDLFRRMGLTISRLFRAIGKAIIVSIIFLLRRWLPLTASVLLGIGASYIAKFVSTKFFTVDMVLRSNAVPSSDVIAYINRLHTYCKEKNTAALKNSLSLPADNINNLVDIAAFWIIDQGKDGIPDYVDYSNTHNVYDTINVRMVDRLDIRLRVETPEELTSFRNGIVYYINSDSLFQQRNRVRLRQQENLSARLNYDIIQLDSLQKVKYFEETRNVLPKTGGQMVFLQEQKTQLVYSDIYSLYSRKQIIEVDLDLYRDIVTMISDFSIPVKRDNGALYYGKYIIPIFFILTVIVLIMLANKKKLREVYNKY